MWIQSDISHPFIYILGTQLIQVIRKIHLYDTRIKEMIDPPNVNKQ